jgi:hypothetical protein
MSRLNALEDQLKDSKMLIQRRDTIVRLGKNPDFRTVILDAFFVEECARYARESGDPALSEVQRADALAMAQAAGHLKRFLNVQILMGNNAENSMAGLEAAIEEERILEQDGVQADPEGYEGDVE